MSPSAVETEAAPATPTLAQVKEVIDNAISVAFADLQTVNKTIHSNPELAWKETIAHDTLCSFLTSHKFKVTPSAYGIKTAFEARHQQRHPGGRCVNFNAEYDALPDIGHACGHNLIASSSLVAFVALSAALEKFDVQGQVQLLGTPAEEDGGGKCVLLEAGAYEGVDASLMGHPTSRIGHGENYTGSAGQASNACFEILCSFYGKNAHAAANPWDGVNALDAVVCAYNNISVLRQQMQPNERVHGCIISTPSVANIVPDYTKVSYSIRSPTMSGAKKLGVKVRACFEAAGLATGCRIEISEETMYADLRVNKTLCERYTAHMLDYGENVCAIQKEHLPASTDQGNVTYAVPALHSSFGIPGDDIFPHNAKFAQCASTDEALECAIKVGKSLALTGWEILTDDAMYNEVKHDFEEDKKRR